MRGSEFIFDSVDALYYDLNNRGGSYIDSPKNNDDKYFQYALTVA